MSLGGIEFDPGVVQGDAYRAETADRIVTGHRDEDLMGRRLDRAAVLLVVFAFVLVFVFILVFAFILILVPGLTTIDISAGRNGFFNPLGRRWIAGTR